jgi:hypothetical protein
MPDAIPVTAGQLAAALDGFILAVVVPSGTRYLRGELPMTARGEIDNPEEVANVLHATLTRVAAEFPEKFGASAPSEADPELRAMHAIVEALAPFENEPPGPVERILRWACDRYEVEVPGAQG